MILVCILSAHHDQLQSNVHFHTIVIMRNDRRADEQNAKMEKRREKSRHQNEKEIRRIINAKYTCQNYPSKRAERGLIDFSKHKIALSAKDATRIK